MTKLEKRMGPSHQPAFGEFTMKDFKIAGTVDTLTSIWMQREKIQTNEQVNWFLGKLVKYCFWYMRKEVSNRLETNRIRRVNYFINTKTPDAVN